MNSICIYQTKSMVIGASHKVPNTLQGWCLYPHSTGDETGPSPTANEEKQAFQPTASDKAHCFFLVPVIYSHRKLFSGTLPQDVGRY